jgi:hypothetical protein
VFRVRHGYTTGTDFLDHTCTRVHRTHGGYRYIPYPFCRGILGTHGFVLLHLDHDSKLMYSTSTPYTEIRPIRPCLTSFAAQIIGQRLSREAASVVYRSSGLRAVVSHKSPLKNVEWVDIGANTVPEVTEILKKYQRLTWYYLTSIAAQKPHVHGGIIPIRKHRPVEVVSLFKFLGAEFERWGGSSVVSWVSIA